jgi:predicted permease
VDALRKGLQRLALLFFAPVTVLAAIWVVDLQSVSLAAMPLFGVFAILLGGVLAWTAAQVVGMPDRKTGAFFVCGSFSNIGSVGALVCFVYLGEEGFALVPMYKIFEEITYYSVGFPLAKYYSQKNGEAGGAAGRIRALIRDPFILAAVTAIGVGGALNVAGVARPAWVHGVVVVFVPLGTALLLVSIGLAMRFGRVTVYLRECLSVAAIKFILVPLTVSSAAYAFGFGTVNGGLPLQVIVILSSMPVAFNALIPPSIYDLDLDLANACWFFTTASLVVVLPLLWVLIGRL